MNDSHWVQWHEAYADPSSSLSRRLKRVQARVTEALNRAPDGDLTESGFDYAVGCHRLLPAPAQVLERAVLDLDAPLFRFFGGGVGTGRQP